MKTLIHYFFIFLSTSSLLAQTPKFVDVPGGSFMMGNESSKKDQGPRHQVKLNDFSISETPITVAQYRIYAEKKELKMPDAPSWGWKNDHPMVNISWSDASNYCNWLSKKLNKDVKLPTEAQWEYAARGGENGPKYKHSGGKKMNNLGWCRTQKINSTKPVATKKPNSLGIYDMNGNVWEWCLDWYASNYYAQSLSQNLENPENTNYGNKKCRVARGGGWDSEASTCTVFHRKDYIPRSSFDDRGFRVVIRK